MNLFAELSIGPGVVLTWIGVGLIAGWMMGLILSGGGLGITADIALGLIGAIVGGIVASFVSVGAAGFWISLLVAALCGCATIALVRVVVPPKDFPDRFQFNSPRPNH